MNFTDKVILITGAAGGIGSCTARRLGSLGSRLILTDVSAGPLSALARELEARGIQALPVVADISDPHDRARLVGVSSELGLGMLVNIAGINPFGLFPEQSDADIEKTFAINTVAPIALCRALVPLLERHEDAHIVNVGSIFGSLAYPGFALYSASKFAIRGFTEALRRELSDTSIQVHYVAPRATRTALSTDRISAMNAQLRVATDDPEVVARAIEHALQRSRREVFLGRPERLFAMLNALVPGLVDRALRKQLPVIRRFAQGVSESRANSDIDSDSMTIAGVRR